MWKLTAGPPVMVPVMLPPVIPDAPGWAPEMVGSALDQARQPRVAVGEAAGWTRSPASYSTAAGSPSSSATGASLARRPIPRSSPRRSPARTATTTSCESWSRAESVTPRSCSLPSRSKTSAPLPACCGLYMRAARAATGSSRSSARPTWPMTPGDHRAGGQPVAPARPA
jgi:hypothetical protein